MRLHRLTGLERDKIVTDLKSVADQIKEYLAILASRARILQILKDELLDIKERFSTPRRTEIEDGSSDMDLEDLIQKEDMVITVSQDGYIKRVPLSTYRAQKRGGKGRTGMNTKNEDAVSDIFVANTHSEVLFFTTSGKVFSTKVYKLPLATPQSKGRAIINLLRLEQDEKIATVLVLHDQNEKEQFLVFATSFGNVRRNKLEDFSNIRSNGLRAICLDEGENLIAVHLATADDDVMLFTKNGLCNRFNLDSNIRIFAGRNSNGVRGIKLDAKDAVVSMMILKSVGASPEERASYIKMINKLNNDTQDTDSEDNSEEKEDTETFELSKERFEELMAHEQFILTITENGYGKRSSSYGYRTSNRGTQGYKSIVVNQRNGGVVASFTVVQGDEIMLVTDGGQLIRCPVNDIRVVGRTSQGVIVFRVGQNEKVVSVSYIPNAGEESLESNQQEDEEIEHKVVD